MTKRGMAATLVGWSVAAALVGMATVGCGDDDATPGVDGGPRVDLGIDLGPADAGSDDLGAPDDAGTDDAGPADLGADDLGPADLGAPDLGGPDMGGFCSPTLVRPSGDVRWPQYPMPGSAGHPRGYHVNTVAAGEETVTDCVTGLEWQRAVDPSSFSQAEAIAHCDGLTYAGFSDWRLATRVELVTLLDYAVATPGPTIDTVAFPGTPAEVFWSGSAIAGTPSMGWFVRFDSGAVDYTGVIYGGRARCVR